MKTILIGTFVCPYCGASSVNEFEPFSQEYAIGECAECGGNFKVYREELVVKKVESRGGKGEVVGKGNAYDRNAQLFSASDGNSGQRTADPETRKCPRCHSDNVKLYNSLKRTFHCIACDAYFNDSGRVIPNPNSPQSVSHRDNRSIPWNGFTDPDAPAKHELGNDGW